VEHSRRIEQSLNVLELSKKIAATIHCSVLQSDPTRGGFGLDYGNGWLLSGLKFSLITLVHSMIIQYSSCAPPNVQKFRFSQKHWKFALRSISFQGECPSNSPSLVFSWLRHYFGSLFSQYSGRLISTPNLVLYLNLYDYEQSFHSFNHYRPNTGSDFWYMHISTKSWSSITSWKSIHPSWNLDDIRNFVCSFFWSYFCY